MTNSKHLTEKSMSCSYKSVSVWTDILKYIDQ